MWTHGRTLTGGMAALTFAGLLAACGGDAPQTRAGQADVTVARALPAPAAPELTTPDTNTMSPPVKDLTKVTYAEAEAVYRSGSFGNATEHFAAFVASNPENGWGHYMLGLSAWKSGDRVRAEQALGRALEIDGDNVKVRTNLGRVLLEEGRAAEALPHVERALDLQPQSPEVWRVLGNVKSELGHSEEALQAYREALLRGENDAWTMNNYGLLLIRLGRYQEAVPPLARAAELTPQSAVFHNNLGVALERSGEPGGALAAFSAALAADSTHGKAQVSLERLQTIVGEEQGDPVDLAAFALSFVDEIEVWRTAQLMSVEVR